MISPDPINDKTGTGPPTGVFEPGKPFRTEYTINDWDKKIIEVETMVVNQTIEQDEPEDEIRRHRKWCYGSDIGDDEDANADDDRMEE